ncbi:hypothetical protein ACH5RR_015004 [Cinchona calisaya]|uniref:Uncharacterized protein n=1 Tax=Cinchona calisaya TaxID=153742 RepID=A0ABD2ZRV8_9GENT
MTIPSSLISNPLFSTIITLYILVRLYLPNIFSPVLISTSILLLFLLRLGATQRIAQEQTQKDQQTHHDFLTRDPKWVSIESSETGSDSDLSNNPCSSSFYADSFVEWDVKAPLEVIYEEYEGEGEEDDDDENYDVFLEEKRDAQMAIIDRYASLSKFYPETDDSDTSSEDFPAISEWDTPENLCFRWEGEDRDGLIEIALEGKGVSDGEEENLIEINLFPVGLQVT